MRVELIEFRLAIRGRRIGFATVLLPDVGLIIHRILVRVMLNGNVGTMLPLETRFAGGEPVRRDDGAFDKEEVLSFSTWEGFTTFSGAVVDAVMAASPEARKAAMWGVRQASAAGGPRSVPSLDHVG